MKENWQCVEFVFSVEVSDVEDIIIVESPIMLIKILQRSKKKNIIFKKIITPRSISTSISTLAETSAPTSTAKTTIKMMKPVR